MGGGKKGTFGFVHEESEGERTFADCVCFCLQFGHCTLVKTAKFEHEMSSGCGFPLKKKFFLPKKIFLKKVYCIDVSNNDNT